MFDHSLAELWVGIKTRTLSLEYPDDCSALILSPRPPPMRPAHRSDPQNAGNTAARVDTPLETLRCWMHRCDAEAAVLRDADDCSQSNGHKSPTAILVQQDCVARCIGNPSLTTAQSASPATGPGPGVSNQISMRGSMEFRGVQCSESHTQVPCTVLAQQ